MKPRRLRFAAWIAALAAILNALLPLAVQAADASGATTTTICSTDGPRTVGFTADSGSGDVGKHHKHCKLCVAGADRATGAALAPAPVYERLQALADKPVPAEAPVLLSRFASPAQPRGPPQAS